MTGRQEHACDYCGLPVLVKEPTPDTEMGPTAAEEQKVFCCYGCRVAASIMGETNASNSPVLSWQLVRLGLALFFSMNVMVIALALWSWDVYDHADLRTANSHLLMDLLRYASLFLASAVLILLAPPLLDNVAAEFRQRRLSMDFLIVSGVAAAFLYSVHSVLTRGEHTYFETSCMVLVSVTFGRWLEAEGKRRTTDSLRSLERLLPESVQRIVGIPEVGSTLVEEPTLLKDVQVGDWLRVRPGSRIPVDGVIRRGQAAIDQRIVSGESTSAVKESGDRVFAGSLNQDGDLLIETQSPPDGGAISRIVDAVTLASRSKGRIQTMAERASACFVPLVAVVALFTMLLHGGFTRSDADGMLTALAVVLIACPCALGIATPLAVWTAMGRAAEAGVLCADADVFQQLAGAKAICFDKTGTLTTGHATLATIATAESQTDVSRSCSGLSADQQEVLLAALAAANATDHPLAIGLREVEDDPHWLNRKLTPDAHQAESIVNVKEIGGRGVTASWEGPYGSRQVALGNQRLMAELQWSVDQRLQERIENIDDGKAFACVGWDGVVRGVFTFEEQIRPDSLAALEELKVDGWQIYVLTGDRHGRGAHLSHTLGVRVLAELLPEQKVDIVRRLQNEHGRVVMVGDGINDAPALAAADVGVAMGCGADVSRESAAVCLLSNDLRRLRWTVGLAQRTMRVVYQNLFWAFSYNSVGIVVAAMGWLNPIIAAIAMIGSSLFVIGNSLRSLGATGGPPFSVADDSPETLEMAGVS